MTKPQAQETIARLVARFEEGMGDYKQSTYNETQTRLDFINPLFKALGWDVDNERGYAEAYREVIHEDKIKISGTVKAPDYSFRLLGGKQLFYVEAKKPSVQIRDQIQPAYQLRRYGWSAKLPISILTDFEEFAVYDCTTKPSENDKPSVGRIIYWNYKDYISNFDLLWDTFSRERVPQGSFDRFIKSDRNKKGTATVDKEFLSSLDTWRTTLAVAVSKQNPTITEDELNFIVQLIIDRIIFLRIAEDRSIEPYGALKEITDSGSENSYRLLLDTFHEADKRYNSGLFDFRKDTISETISLDNKTIKNIITDLYYPKSPYEFSVLSVDILGSAYEQFLGKTIRLEKNHRAKVEEKPEVRKAGGVYYTPQYIVDYIVQNTVGKLVENKTPEEVAQLTIVDPACGSGSFLLGAYQFLLDWHKEYYTTHKPSKKEYEAIFNPVGGLSTTIKKQILLNNIYGVDIDANAVEVTKLSLLLKCMEGETSATINHQLSFFKERLLPTLDNNIKCGNSLIDLDFYDSQLDFGEERKIKPFSWQKSFSTVFAKGGFNAVIGNPPYVRIHLIEAPQRDYFRKTYSTAIGQIDLYTVFIEKSIKLLKTNGFLSFIVPRFVLFNIDSEPIRKLILGLKPEFVTEVGRAFQGVDTEAIVFVLSNSISEIQTLAYYEYLPGTHVRFIHDVNKTRFSSFLFTCMNMIITDSELELIKKIESGSELLGDISEIRRGAEIGKSTIREYTTGRKVLLGEDVGAFQINWNATYLHEDDINILKYAEVSKSNKVLIRRVSSELIATLDLQGYYFIKNLYSVVSDRIDLFLLTGLLNSKTLRFYFKKYFTTKKEELFPEIQLYQIRSLPISKNDNNEIIQNIVSLVRSRFSTTIEANSIQVPDLIDRAKSRIDYIEDRINQLVYQLYNLTEEEIQIIEESTK